MKANPKVAITGGAGHFGLTLASELINLGYSPVLIDRMRPTGLLLPAQSIFMEIDVRNQEALTTAFQGCIIVFHVASYGMSGSCQLNRRLVEDVNINGTTAVLAAAVSAGVERLVVTSTYNVVFGGQSITCGDEKLPYFPITRHPDVYSATKARAEMAVLSANMTPIQSDLTESQKKQKNGTRNGRKLTGGEIRRSQSRVCTTTQRYLRTCAIRPAAIWGPHETRHLPRVVKYLEQGLFFFTFGDPAAKMDFVHVRNLAEAHILAAEGLTAERGYVAAGQAYFVSDGEDLAVNNFEFFRPLVEGLGYQFPRLRLPLLLVYWVAFLLEIVHWAVHRWLPFEPLLTRAEVYKAGVNHWFSIDKAREELGYRPRCYDIREVIRAFKAKGHFIIPPE